MSVVDGIEDVEFDYIGCGVQYCVLETFNL